MPKTINLHGIVARGDWEDTISARSFMKQLNDAGGERVALSINSEGGEVFEGVAIFEAARKYEGGIDVTIDGLAGSIAAYIAMAGDTITIADGGHMMTHAAWKFTMGDADEHRQAADMLDSISDAIVGAYAGKTGMTKDAARESFMSGEKWFNAEAAVAIGLADRTSGSHGAPANIADPSIYSHLPDAILAQCNKPASQPPLAARVVHARYRKQEAVNQFVRVSLGRFARDQFQKEVTK